MAVITLFAAVTQATGQQLDDNLTLTSAQAPIPCTVSGSNVLTLTQKTNVYSVTAYTNNMQFCGVFTGSNTLATTAQLGSLAALPIYKYTITGPTPLTGGECIAGNAFTLMYDSALNAGGGGFHLFSAVQDVGTPLNPSSIKLGVGATLSRYTSATASVSFSIFGPNSSQESIIVVSGIALNDAVQIGPPSMTNQPLSFIGYVPAPGSVNLRAINAASVSVTLAAGIFRVTGMG